ncbi:MAG: hypothetical protein WCN27_05045 [Alphaproteobacteria bacterium]
MTLPSTNISMQGIAAEAGGVFITNIYASDLFKKSYFEGPNGSYNITYNAWGQYGNTSGANVIYNVSSKNTDNAWTDFSLKTYFYDNSTYLVGLRMDNTLPPPGGGYNNDYTVYVELWDSSYTYTYVTTGAILLSQGTTFPKAYISISTTPIIASGYWRITFISDNLDISLPPVRADIYINGNMQMLPLTNSPYSTDTFTGTESVAYYSGFYNGTGLQFDIVIRT